MIEIKEVKTKRDLRLFASYPIKLYKDCPYYVPSIRSDEINTFNPKKSFSLKENECKVFLCYKDGKLVGRIAGLINNTYNKITGKKLIRFSRFECIDDIEVFKALLGAVEKFGSSRGMDTIHGPWGFNDTDREGMLTYGSDKVSTYAANYYYPYFYQRMIELGFLDESKWLEKKFVVPEKHDERMDRIAKRIKDKFGLVDVAETMSVRKILKKYGDEFFETLTDAYGHLDGYVPIVGEARKNVLDQFATIINRRYISIIVDKKGHIAALGVCLPSIVKPLIKHRGRLFPFGFIGVLRAIHKPDALEMALIAVKSEYKNTGVNALVISRILNNIIDDGIVDIESNLMLENNFSIQQQWKFVDSEVLKRRQTYIKPIGSLVGSSENDADVPEQSLKECAVTE